MRATPKIEGKVRAPQSVAPPRKKGGRCLFRSNRWSCFLPMNRTTTLVGRRCCAALISGLCRSTALPKGVHGHDSRPIFGIHCYPRTPLLPPRLLRKRQEILQQLQPHFLTFLGMELRRKYILVPDRRREGFPILGSRGDNRFILGPWKKTVHEVEIAKVRNLAE